jgi:hypothetical protein
MHQWVFENGLGAKVVEAVEEKLKAIGELASSVKSSGGPKLALINPTLAFQLYESVFKVAPDLPKEQVPILVQQIIENKTEQSFTATNELVDQLQDQLADQKFEATLEKGEGATNLARKVIHDYLVNVNKSGDGLGDKMTTEQMMFAEDWLLKHKMEKYVEGGVNHAFKLGEEIPAFEGADAKEAIEAALQLKQDQLENLHHYAEKLSEKNCQ